MLAQRRAIRNCDVTNGTSADDQAASRFRPPPHHSVRHGEICRWPRDRLRAWRLFLPILTEEKGLDTVALAQLEASAERSGTFTRDLPGSDAFHWGEGTVRASDTRIWLEGKISPGPDYRLYLTPSLATDEASFLKIKGQSVQVGEVKAFSNFSLDVPPGITVGDYPAVLIWCEAFGEFITAAELN